MNETVVELRMLKQGITNFRDFQQESRDFYATYEEREKNKTEEAEKLEKQIKERRRNLIAIGGIAAAALVSIGIAVAGWSYTNVVKPILDDIYANHPAIVQRPK